MARVIRLPDRGRLLVCTDLQGCMRDYQRMVAVFGPAATARMRGSIHTFVLAAVSKCGAIFTHGAPTAVIESIADLEAADLSGAGLSSPLDVLDTPIVDKMQWARSASEAEARRFLRALGGTMSIYGHDVIPEGYEMDGDEQIIKSTSFGLIDTNKQN